MRVKLERITITVWLFESKSSLMAYMRQNIYIYLRFNLFSPMISSFPPMTSNHRQVYVYILLYYWEITDRFRFNKEKQDVFRYVSRHRHRHLFISHHRTCMGVNPYYALQVFTWSVNVKNGARVRHPLEGATSV